MTEIRRKQVIKRRCEKCDTPCTLFIEKWRVDELRETTGTTGVHGEYCRPFRINDVDRCPLMFDLVSHGSRFITVQPGSPKDGLPLGFVIES